MRLDLIFAIESGMLLEVAKEKHSTVADKIVCDQSRHLFFCDDNEQTSDEGGQRARQRGFVSEIENRSKKINQNIKGVEEGK